MGQERKSTHVTKPGKLEEPRWLLHLCFCPHLGLCHQTEAALISEGGGEGGGWIHLSQQVLCSTSISVSGHGALTIGAAILNSSFCSLLSS